LQFVTPTQSTKMVLGYTKIENGEILLIGKDVVEHESSIKNDIGVVFDDFHVPETLNVTQLDKITKKYLKHGIQTIF
jgi:ABC-2 type transport system ATP-binding protein